MKSVVVTVDPDHTAVMGSIAEVLRGQGMQVDQVLEEIGIISGRVSPDQPLSQMHVEGVSSVEEGAHFQLPPPDAPIQ
jgi:hypothetical protein